MIRQLIRFLRSYARGEDIQVNFHFEIAWLDLGFILAITGLVIYIIVKW